MEVPDTSEAVALFEMLADMLEVEHRGANVPARDSMIMGRSGLLSSIYEEAKDALVEALGIEGSHPIAVNVRACVATAIPLPLTRDSPSLIRGWVASEEFSAAVAWWAGLRALPVDYAGAVLG